MPAILIRHLSPQLHRAIKMRAAQYNSTMQEEARRTLEEAFRPGPDARVGSALDFFGGYWLEGDGPRMERERDPPRSGRVR